jgi:hypothetical protein
MRAANHLTRRDLLRWGAGSLLAAGLWPGALRAEGGGTSEEFSFLVVNDTHFVNQRCAAWLERVVKQMKGHDEKIDLCLHLGDLSDHGKAAELTGARDAFRGLGLPTHVVVGNHDHLTQNDRKAYEELFPKQVNYSFEHRGWQFLGLDTTQGRDSIRTLVPAATLRWLDDTLPRLDKKRPTVVFSHFPLGPKHLTRPTNADALLERFKEHNLRAVFGGHWHGLTERHLGEVVLTTNRCCAISKGNHDGSKEKGYFLAHAKDGKVGYRFVEVRPV